MTPDQIATLASRAFAGCMPRLTKTYEAEIGALIAQGVAQKPRRVIIQGARGSRYEPDEAIAARHLPLIQYLAQHPNIIATKKLSVEVLSREPGYISAAMKTLERRGIVVGIYNGYKRTTWSLTRHGRAILALVEAALQEAAE